MSIQMEALRSLLWWRSRPGIVRQFLASRPFPRARRAPQVKGIRVATVQLPLEWIEDPRDFAQMVYRWTAEAVQDGAELVVFPEGIGASLLALYPGLREMADGGTARHLLEELGQDGLELADLFHVIGPAVQRVWSATCGEVARGFGIHLVGGSAMLPAEKGRVRNVTALFGPDGRILHRQSKVHPLPVESRWGLSPGRRIRTVSTPLAGMGLLLSTDADYFESVRLLALTGADLVALPAAFPAPYPEARLFSGAWARAQESRVVMVQSTLTGDFLGLSFGGRSGIYAPLDLTPRGDGILAEAGGPEAQVVLADVDLEALSAYRQQILQEPRGDILERVLAGDGQAHREIAAGDGKRPARAHSRG